MNNQKNDQKNDQNGMNNTTAPKGQSGIESNIDNNINNNIHSNINPPPPKKHYRKYPLDNLIEGQCINIVTTTYNDKAQKAAINSAYAYGKRNNKKFSIKRTKYLNPQTGLIEYSVRIWRVSLE